MPIHIHKKPWIGIQLVVHKSRISPSSGLAKGVEGVATAQSDKLRLTLAAKIVKIRYV